MTTTAAKPRTRRAGVPAVDTDPAPTSSVVDALALPRSSALVQPLALAVLHPHPSNPRRDLGDLTELADSIRAHGIRQNLLVVPDPDHAGEWRIVIGHRRAAAAAEVARGENADTTVPCAIDTDLDEAGQLELMLLENLQRTDLSAVEEANGYQGLLDLGVGARAIAHRTGRSEKTITTRLRLLTLPETAREKVHTHQATLDDALALAGFDGDEDLRADLVDTFGVSGFAHRLESARREMAERTSVAQARAELDAVGITVLESGEYGRAPAGVTQLYVLKGKKAHSGLTTAEHADCPGHVAWIYPRGGRADVTYGCQDATGNGHTFLPGYGNSGSTAGPMTDTEKAERKKLIANNKAAAAAQTVRQAWIRDLLKRPKMPDDAAVYVARIIHPGTSADYREKATLDALLYGKAVTDRDVDADRSTPAGAMRHLVALAAARVENSMPKDYWRSDWAAHRIHLTQLAAWGYELADVEREYLTKAAKAGGRS